MKSVKFILLFFPLMCFFLLSCSDAPRTSIGKKALEERINKESNGKIKLVSFEKLNGIKRTVPGQDIYEMEYNATIEFVEATYKTGAFGQYFSDFRVIDQPSVWDPYPSKKYHKGQQVNLTGWSLMFEKTERGWRAKH